jgi:hypothetical protein
VAILSSAVATVYSNKMTPFLTGKGLPAPAMKAASGSIGGTKDVLLIAQHMGRITQQQYDLVWTKAVASYMSSMHVATALSAGLVIVALIILIWRLPAQAEAVAWAAAPSGAAPLPEGELDALEADASSQIKDVDDRALAHGDVEVDVDGVRDITSGTN